MQSPLPVVANSGSANWCPDKWFHIVWLTRSDGTIWVNLSFTTTFILRWKSGLIGEWRVTVANLVYTPSDASLRPFIGMQIGMVWRLSWITTLDYTNDASAPWSNSPRTTLDCPCWFVSCTSAVASSTWLFIIVLVTSIESWCSRMEGHKEVNCPTINEQVTMEVKATNSNDG